MKLEQGDFIDVVSAVYLVLNESDKEHMFIMKHANSLDDVSDSAKGFTREHDWGFKKADPTDIILFMTEATPFIKELVKKIGENS